MKNIIAGRSAEAVSMIPTTPEEIAAAKKRLQDQKYKCAVCQDSKFVYPRDGEGRPIYNRTIPCQCVRIQAEKKRIDNLLKYCELPPKGKKMTFSTFKQSPATAVAYAACLALAKGQNQETFTTLLGNSNHGKTHLAIAVCNYRLAANQIAKYAYLPSLLSELRQGFKPGADDSYLSRFQTFLDVPLLLADDLGTENSTPWAQEQLDYLFDYRLMHELPTLVTSNLPEDMLPFRIANRLKRDGQIITITGPEFKKK